MLRRLVFISITLVFVTLFSATLVGPAAAAGDSVTLSLKEWRMDLSSTTVQVGVPVRFDIINRGVIPHGVEIEKAGVVNQPLQNNGSKAVVDNIAPGTSKSLTWTFTEPGTYWVACQVPGHFEAGMKAAFIVVAAAANPPANPPANNPNPPATNNKPPATTNNTPPTTNNPPAATNDAPETQPATDASNANEPDWLGGNRTHLC